MPLCIVQARRATVSVVLYSLAMRANGSRSGLSGHMNNATEYRSHAARANCRCHAAAQVRVNRCIWCITGEIPRAVEKDF
ncbi:uncharacterized protein BBA_00099 [Beauveria bassiana ARSEF 2860]|uniref:Uncharacterized protein n=1 Tax=Beauveria bassiana (strain ARSEF 2860) TaxID=655819 RepID=J4KR76_BEAB2|nr:uncharacterized protein BBA_00099 [Beauveria bassiana ARSEF 2860]EJP70469.1 hypothetical protein BBA_00099 [Beauveria bassiana ARSEF 2860]